MAFKDIQEAAHNYALGEFPEEWGPGKKFMTKEHCEAQCKSSREIAEKHFICGATYMAALQNADPTKATVEK